MDFTGIGEDFWCALGILPHGEEAAELQASFDSDVLALALDELEIQRQVGLEALGLGSNADDFQVVQGRDQFTELVSIDLFGLVLDTFEFPLVGEVLAGQRADFPVGRGHGFLVERVIVDGQVGDVVPLDLQQIRFDPVGELGREVNLAFGDIDIIVVGCANVVAFGAVVAVGILDLHADDVVGQHGVVGVLERDPSSEPLAEGVGLAGIEHPVLFVVLLVLRLQVSPRDAIHRGGCLGQSPLGVGWVIVVAGDHVQLRCRLLLDLERTRLESSLVEDDQFQRFRIQRTEVAVERFAEIAGLVALRRCSAGIDDQGQNDRDHGGPGETKGVASFGIHAVTLKGQVRRIRIGGDRGRRCVARW